MKWLNRIGMLFEFLSFWFAVPEIVGEERLRALERKVESVLKLTPKAVAVVAVMTAMVVLLLLLAISYTPASYYLSYVYSDVNHLDWLYDSCCCLGLYTIALGNLVGFLAYVVWLRLIALAVNVSSRLLAMLADDQALRWRCLTLGAVMFIIGFLLQFITTFWVTPICEKFAVTDTMITRRHQDDSLTPSPTKVGALAGRAADEAAARSAFVDYRSKRAANTLRRQNADLAHFARYLVEAMAARH